MKVKEAEITLESIALNSKIKENENDYVGENGLMYCYKCNTPKQYRLKLKSGKEIVVPVMCKCASDEYEAQRKAIEYEQKMAAIRSLKENSLIDNEFLSCTFENATVTDDNRKQIAICKRYASKFDELCEKNQGLLLYGNVGTGKTYAACCIGNILLNKCTTVFATSLVKIINESGNSGVDGRVMRFIKDAKLLILDDLGAERSTDYAIEMVYNVIDTRSRANKPMIITTNLTLNEMKEPNDVRYKRLYDRILKTCYPIQFSGKSLRKKEAKERFCEMEKLLEE